MWEALFNMVAAGFGFFGSLIQRRKTADEEPVDAAAARAGTAAGAAANAAASAAAHEPPTKDHQ